MTLTQINVYAYILKNYFSRNFNISICKCCCTKIFCTAPPIVLRAITPVCLVQKAQRDLYHVQRVTE